MIACPRIYLIWWFVLISFSPKGAFGIRRSCLMMELQRMVRFLKLILLFHLSLAFIHRDRMWHLEEISSFFEANSFCFGQDYGGKGTIVWKECISKYGAFRFISKVFEGYSYGMIWLCFISSRVDMIFLLFFHMAPSPQNTCGGFVGVNNTTMHYPLRIEWITPFQL